MCLYKPAQSVSQLYLSMKLLSNVYWSALMFSYYAFPSVLICPSPKPKHLAKSFQTRYSFFSVILRGESMWLAHSKSALFIFVI